MSGNPNGHADPECGDCGGEVQYCRNDRLVCVEPQGRCPECTPDCSTADGCAGNDNWVCSCECEEADMFGCGWAVGMYLPGALAR